MSIPRHPDFPQADWTALERDCIIAFTEAEREIAALLVREEIIATELHILQGLLYDERNQVQALRAQMAADRKQALVWRDQMRVLREALSDFVACHACGGFVEPESQVIDAARAALEATKP